MPRPVTELTLARKFKRAGGERAEFVAVRQRACEAAARRDGWRPSELAATIADVTMAADKVWPATREG